jgi:hypothetical protein
MWFPLSMQEQVIPAQNLLNASDVSWLQVMGRLNPAATAAQAAAQTTTLAHQQITAALSGETLTADVRKAIDRTLTFHERAREFRISATGTPRRCICSWEWSPQFF